MKKKLFVLSSLALLLTLNVSGCSLLTDVLDDIDLSGDNGENSGNENNNQNSQYKDVNYQPSRIVVNNKQTIYQVDDIFAIPDVSIIDDQDKEHKLSSGFTVSTKKLDDPNYDASKSVDIDMSKTTGEEGVTIYVAFQYSYKKDSSTIIKGSISHSYKIRITSRRDSHYDPEDDLLVKTLQISDVNVNFNQGDTFIKPKVWAVKHDNTKSEITDSCIFEGYDMDKYGYQNVTVTYNNHTISYEIVIHNQEEEKQYPFIDSVFNQRLNIQKETFVKTQKGQLYIVTYEKDGSVKNYGIGFGTILADVDYSSDNPDVVTIDNDGVFQAKAPGTAYLYVTINDTNGEAASTFRAKIVVEEKKLVELKVNNYKYNYYSGHSVNFAADVMAVYQNGYEEAIVPTIDLSGVDTSTPGEYNVKISYTLNGKTLSLNKTINILDSSLYVLNKTELQFSIEDYNTNLQYGGTPVKGNVKSIVVPVKFTDSDNFISNYDNVREDIEKCFFGTNEDVGWRSVKTYYEEESAGLLTYSGSVSDIYEDSHPSTFYYKDSNPDLRDEVVDWFFTKHPEEDIKDYDINNDGYIDCLNLVYLAPDATTSRIGRDIAGNLWGMVKSNSRTPNFEKPVPARYFWASYDFMYPTEDIALARTGKSKYSEPGFFNGNSNRGNEKLEARTFIHETAHMLGIDDYYSYSENVYFAGELNMQTLNYMGHDPYSLMLYNWANPYIPEITSNITIGDFQTTHDVILLTPSWNSIDSPFDEYFLLDLYVPSTGLNAFDATVKYPTNAAFNTIGVRLWHVDSRLATSTSHFDDFSFNPNDMSVRIITDNSYNREGEDEQLKKYDRFMLLQLVRNVKDYDYATSGNVAPEHYFQAGDTFSMSDFSTQFVNGDKMDNGKELGWTFKIDGIYNSAEGYIADITVTRK